MTLTLPAGRLVTVEAHAHDRLMVRLNVKHADGRMEHVVTRFIEFDAGAVTLGKAVGEGRCPPGILADYIEERPGLVRAGLDAGEVCAWLRDAG